MIDWNIKGRSTKCIWCDKMFFEKETFYSVVSDTATQEATDIIEKIRQQNKDEKELPDYIRLDFCKDCWNNFSKRKWISTWKGVFVPPQVTINQTELKETTESLLRRLIDEDETPDNIPIIFVLAVMLERKKILIERAVRKLSDNTILRVYEHKKNGEVIFITDPNLSLEQIPDVQKRVMELLNKPSTSTVTKEEKSSEETTNIE